MNSCKKDYRAQLLLVWILMAIFGLAACRSVGPSPLASPLPAPMTGTSPIATIAPHAAVRIDLDPAQAVLRPADMGDLFQAIYSVSQPYQRDGVRGIQVTYPTKVIDHTSGFVEGFASQIEIYDDVNAAAKQFKTITEGFDGESLEIAPIADETSARLTATRQFETVPSDAPDADNFAYVIVFRKANALAIITLKTPKALPLARLEQTASVVADRLTEMPR